MKKIKFLTSISTLEKSFYPGQEVEWDSEEAERFIERGMAENVEVVEEVEQEKPVRKPRKKSGE